MLHVPYKGGGLRSPRFWAARCRWLLRRCRQVVSYVSPEAAGIAITTAQRSPSLPNLPTVGEAGVANYDVGSWYGLSVPTGTPKEIIARLHAETIKLLALQDVKDASIGGFDVTSTPEQYGDFVRTEVEDGRK